MPKFLGQAKSPIARKLPSGNLSQWKDNIPQLHHVDEHVQRVIACAPASWRAVIEKRFAYANPPLVDTAMSAQEFCAQQPTWVQAWDLLQAIADFEDMYGGAGLWELSDHDIRDMAQALADDVSKKDALAVRCGTGLRKRLDDVKHFIRCVGVLEDTPLEGEPAIARASCPLWWRKRLRVHVARTVEAGSISLGRVHKGTGGYVSREGLVRRQGQKERSAEMLAHTLVRNEAGQHFALADLAALSVSNPVIRGGEMMTRIRGAEEYADARGHVGLFVALTTPSKYHAVRTAAQGRVVRNKKYCGANPREGQMFLRKNWQLVRSAMGRAGIKMYGVRVAEPHHDGTPHWHLLVWLETEAEAKEFEAIVRRYWLREDGDEPGAQQHRVDFKRMEAGGAAGYVAKYIAKNIGHHALAEHQDMVNGHQLNMDFAQDMQPDAKALESGPGAETLHDLNAGARRVDAWAGHWGIRQFQFFGMPPVTAWRALRRVTPDQLDLFHDEGDKQTLLAYQACHRHGDMRADWRMFMEAMGGHALHRSKWHLRTEHRVPEPGQANRYGEEIKRGCVVGVVPQRGRMRGHPLISRRMGFQSVMRSPEALAQAEPGSRAALPPPWTGFNNCTTGRLSSGFDLVASGQITPWSAPKSVTRPEINPWLTPFEACQ
ncbi:replication endonuclease [Comamonas sp. CMM01]|uniref:replication endonuclease n=1 Tax=Comamonas sp. CMM01 TaxID=2769280 RepID=UPI00178209FF|nr:replication endonuclease [Comamonas sp. CMM01]MBD9530616.1 replication endonuclease [Comamonas sp. CMM01]